MRCPHCAAELKYRQRGGRRCSSCRQEFALEPRQNPLGLHDLRLRRLDEQLSAGGRLRYSADQLRHAAARKLLEGQKHPMVFGCFLVPALFVGGVVALAFERPALAGALALLIVGAGLVARSIVYRRPVRRRIPIDLDRFEREVIGRYQQVYGRPPPGLIGAGEPGGPAPAELRGAIVCPDPAVRACLLANGAADRLGLAVLPAAPPLAPAEQAQLEELRRRPDLPLLTLHDASPAGCALAESVAAALGLPAGRRVIDLGLRPRAASRRRLPVLSAPPAAELIGQLRRQGRLGAEELAWLEAGNVAPIAGLPPARLLALVERAAPAGPAGAGFMSWPEQQ